MHEIFLNNPAIIKIIEDLADVARLLWEKGWAERNAGNISFNITDDANGLSEVEEEENFTELKSTFPQLAENVLLVTGTGTRMRDIPKSPKANLCIIRLNKSGNAYSQIQIDDSTGSVLPTSEIPSHLAIHNMLIARGKPEKIILHTHPTNLIALTHIRDFCNQDRINNMLWSIQPETCVFIDEGVGFIPYLQTGSEALAEATIAKLQDHRIALWEKHGCLAIGKNAHEAFDLIDIAEKSAEIFFTCKSAGFDVEGISKKDLDSLRTAFGLASRG